MINICIKDIVEATKGKLLCGDEKQQIDHLSIDSRSSQGNDLFIPIIGAKVDAHRFIDGAFSVGCVATLTSEHDSMDDPNHAWIAWKILYWLFMRLESSAAAVLLCLPLA